MEKEKFFIAINELVDGKIKINKKEVEGSRLENDFGLDLFIRKYKSKYIISEVKSGRMICTPQKTKKEAISTLNQLLKTKDIEQVKSVIERAIKMESE